jgi:hypothetical protein
VAFVLIYKEPSWKQAKDQTVSRLKNRRPGANGSAWQRILFLWLFGKTCHCFDLKILLKVRLFCLAFENDRPAKLSLHPTFADRILHLV